MYHFGGEDASCSWSANFILAFPGAGQDSHRGRFMHSVKSVGIFRKADFGNGSECILLPRMGDRQGEEEALRTSAPLVPLKNSSENEYVREWASNSPETFAESPRAFVGVARTSVS